MEASLISSALHNQTFHVLTTEVGQGLLELKAVHDSKASLFHLNKFYNVSMAIFVVSNNMANGYSSEYTYFMHTIKDFLKKRSSLCAVVATAHSSDWSRTATPLSTQ